MRNPLRLSERNLLLLLSLIVGVCAGCAAVILESVIKFIQDIVQPLFAGKATVDWTYFVLPGAGMIASFLIIRYLVHDNISHGVTKVLVAISRNDSRIKPHNMWSSIVTSSLTIGLGGSVGAEAPIVYTGAAIGSNLGQKFHLSRRSVTILVGCGAAGAIAGIFKAPLAGVLFTLEILFFNISMSSMMPLLLSTVSATVVSYLFLGATPAFACELTPFSIGNLPFYVVLGLFCGCCSMYFERMTLWLEDRFAKFRNPLSKWLVCALGLGLLISFFPPLFGEGYGTLRTLLTGGDIVLDGKTPFSSLLSGSWGVPLFFLIVLLLKVFSMTFTNAGGGVGGTFGPTLVVGGLAGFVLARSFNLGFDLTLPENNFVLVGMAGLMAGVMQAPMTAIFLIAEITGGYDLFLPLIVCSSFSFLTMRIWEKYSIYTKRIAQSGDLLTHDNDQAAMALMDIRELIRDKYPVVTPKTTLREIRPIFEETSSAVFAVVDKKGIFRGMIEMDSIRRVIFNTDEYDSITARDLLIAPPAVVLDTEKMDAVMQKFDRTDAWRLPVVTADGRYLGFVSRSRILTSYRSVLKSISLED